MNDHQVKWQQCLAFCQVGWELGRTYSLKEGGFLYVSECIVVISNKVEDVDMTDPTNAYLDTNLKFLNLCTSDIHKKFM